MAIHKKMYMYTYYTEMYSAYHERQLLKISLNMEPFEVMSYNVSKSLMYFIIILNYNKTAVLLCV